jgi:hypothetical protein
MKQLLVILFFLQSGLLGAAHASAIQFNHRWEFSGNLQGTDLNQEGFSSLEQKGDFFGLIALDQSLKWDSFFFEVRPELRIVNSTAFRAAPGDIAQPVLIDQTRVMDFHQQLWPSKDRRETTIIISDIEKLNLRYQSEQLDALIGRNPFNPSILRLSPIWNKFSRNVFSQAYPGLQFNPDVAQIKFTHENIWIQNANVQSDFRELSSYLLLMGWAGESIEVQGLAGLLFDETTVGFNASYTSSESLYKMELLRVLANESFLVDHLEFALGYESSWTSQFSVVFEYLYNDISDNFEDPKDLNLGVSKFWTLRSKHYFLSQWDYQWNEVWSTALIPILNLDDASLSMGLNLRWLVNDDSELWLQGRIGFGKDQSEFSDRSIVFPDSRYLGYNHVISLGGRVYF